MNGPSPDARQRLLEAAAEVFAVKGYAQASTREICRLAGANVAAIHYYFGDKASLYREIFQPAELLLRLPAELTHAEVALHDALLALYRHLLSFAVAPRKAQYMRMLFVREQLEPTGVLAAGQAEVLRPFHEQLLQFVVERLGARGPDLALHQLAFSLVGIGMAILVERGTVEQLVPGMIDSPSAVDATAQRLADAAVTLMQAEQRRRETVACANELPKARGADGSRSRNAIRKTQVLPS